jgi:hypothetical protein
MLRGLFARVVRTKVWQKKKKIVFNTPKGVKTSFLLLLIQQGLGFRK